jgi:ATP-dependent helicase/nuclease subunit B
MPHPENAMLILPTHKWVTRAKKDFIRYNYDKRERATGKLQFYRLLDFAHNCLDKLGCKYKLLSDAAILSFIEEAMAAEKDNLEYYGNTSLNLLQKIKDVLLGLKEDGITPENMATELTESQNVVSAEKRFHDITTIYKRYNELLGDYYLDEPAIYTKLFNELQRTDIDDLLNTEFMYIHGFSEFKLPEVAILSYLSDSKTPTLIDIDYTRSVGPNVESLPENVRRLVLNSHFNQKSTNEADANTKTSQYLRKWLYKDNYTKYNDELRKQIIILESKDRETEVKNLAKLAIHLNSEYSMNYSDICICSRNPSKYANLFREFFSESGIVVNVSDRFPLATAVPVVLIFALLEIVARRWKRVDIERIAHYSEVADTIPNIITFINIAKKYRIIGGISSSYWESTLERYRDSTIKRLNWLQQDETRDTLEDERLSKEIAMLEEAIKAWRKLDNILDLKEDKYTFSDFANIIRERLLNGFGIKQSIINKCNDLSQKSNKYSISNFQLLEELEKNIKALEQFEKVINETEDIEIERDRNKKYKLDELIDKLKVAVAGAKYQISEKNSLGINITSIEQTRGIPYKAMILCGLVDSEFPLPFRMDTFIGKELPNSEDLHNDNERVLFYQFLTNNLKLLDIGEMKIYISYPQLDDGKKLIRSSFIDDLCLISNEKAIKEYIINIEEELKHNKINDLRWINYITLANEILLQNSNKKNKEDYKNNIVKPIKREYLSANSLKYIENLDDRVYSISQLESYVNCPFQYFMQYIVKPELPETYLDDELSALDVGNYLHKILEEFYKNNAKSHNYNVYGFSSFDVSPETELRDRYFNELVEIAKSLFKELDFPLYRYEIERIIGKNGVLSTWLDNELEKRDAGWLFSSILFEQKFGDGAGYTLYNAERQTIKLKGKVDRIELINNDLDGNGNKYFIISDYKRSISGISKLADIRDKQSLQIPIYLSIIRDLYKNNEFVPYGGLYYVLIGNRNKDSKNNYVKWAMREDNEYINDKDNKYMKEVKNSSALPTNELEQILDDAIEKAITCKNQITNLEYTPKNKSDKSCNYCKYNHLCKTVYK